jgi:glycosyltransferase involved in cell wall biosynthesis
MKKVLMVATVPYMIGQFNMNNIGILQELQYEVHIACNFKDRSSWTEKEVSEFIAALKERNIVYHQIDFSRSPFNIQKDIVSYKELKKLVKSEKYEFMHCHTPVGGVIGRLVAHEAGIKVIYTAHGFHFYNGAPKKNWLLFYPVEKMCSRWTDVLITINKEDYVRAKNKFYAKKTIYVPGVGIDTQKFNSGLINSDEKRNELGLKPDEYMFLSVGELSKRKNHEVVIRALSKIKNQNYKYFIVGNGNLKEHLMDIIKELGLLEKVFLLGYRTDVSELCQAADVFVFPSHQEGLPVALMEAIACKTFVVCSSIRGNKDLVLDEKNLFNENEELELIKCLDEKMEGKSRKDFLSDNRKCIDSNYEHLKQFDLTAVENQMRQLYEEYI